MYYFLCTFFRFLAYTVVTGKESNLLKSQPEPSPTPSLPTLTSALPVNLGVHILPTFSVHELESYFPFISQ